MEHSQALKIAEDWIERLRPTCDRIEIAGSVRRGKAEVHDIEICAVPRIMNEVDMFGQVSGLVNQVEATLDELAYRGEFRFSKNGPKYKQLALLEGINLDLFIVTPPAQWGVIFLIRTGPADFSRWTVTPRWQGGALPSGYLVHEGRVTAPTRRTGDVAMPEEIDFLKFCGLPWIEPKDREARWGGSFPHNRQ